MAEVTEAHWERAKAYRHKDGGAPKDAFVAGYAQAIADTEARVRAETIEDVAVWLETECEEGMGRRVARDIRFMDWAKRRNEKSEGEALDAVLRTYGVEPEGLAERILTRAEEALRARVETRKALLTQKEPTGPFTEEDCNHCTGRGDGECIVTQEDKTDGE